MIFRIATTMSTELTPSVVDHDKLAQVINQRASEHLGNVLSVAFSEGIRAGSKPVDFLEKSTRPEKIAEQVAFLVNNDLSIMLDGLSQEWGAIDMYATVEFEDSYTLIVTLKPRWYHAASNEVH
jgi:hypothetical protein